MPAQACMFQGVRVNQRVPEQWRGPYGLARSPIRVGFARTGWRYLRKGRKGLMSLGGRPDRRGSRRRKSVVTVQDLGTRSPEQRWLGPQTRQFVVSELKRRGSLLSGVDLSDDEIAKADPAGDARAFEAPVPPQPLLEGVLSVPQRKQVQKQVEFDQGACGTVGKKNCGMERRQSSSRKEGGHGAAIPA